MILERYNIKKTILYLNTILVIFFHVSVQAQVEDKPNLFCLEISLGKDSAKEWDGKLEIVNPGDEDEFLYVGINMGYGKQGNAQQAQHFVEWQGKAEAREIWDWAKPFNKTVEGYTPEKDKMPFKPFVVNAYLKAAPNSKMLVSTINGKFYFVPGELEYGMPGYFLDQQVKITRVYPSRRLTNEEYISNRKKYHGFPSAATNSLGETYIVFSTNYEGISPFRYHSFKDELPTDFSYLAQKSDGDGLNLIVEKDNEIISKKSLTTRGNDIGDLSVTVDEEDKVWIAWSENVDGNKDIYAMYLKGDKLSKTIRVTDAPGPDLNPVIASYRDKVIVTWQGFRENSFDILYADLSGGMAYKELPVANTNANEWQPAIAVDSEGNFAIAWDTYQNLNYDVYYTIINAKGKMAGSKPVAVTSGFEVRPSIVFDDEDRLWIAYEKAGENWGKDNGVHNFIDPEKGEGLYETRSIRVVCTDGNGFFTTRVPVEEVIPKETRYTKFYDKVRSPGLYHQSSTPNHYLNSPVLAKGDDGHILLVYKKNADETYTIKWHNCFMYYDGSSWSNPVKIGGSIGQMHEVPAITIPERGQPRVVQASDYEADNGLIKTNDLFRQNIWLSFLQVPGSIYEFDLVKIPAPVIPKYDPTLEKEVEDVETLENYRATINGKTYRILKGDSHRHTSFSGDGSHDSHIEDCYRYAFDAAKLDWVSNGDHDNGYNEYHWWLTQKYTDFYHLDGEFVSLFGYERSCGYPDGHRNVIFTRHGIRMLPRVSYNKSAHEYSSPDTRLLYAYLNQFNGLCISHTSATKTAGTDWRELNTVHEPVLEIYQGERMTAECATCPRFNDDLPWFPPNYKGLYRKVLGDGHHLGVIASSDHKSTHVSFAMVYASEFSREGIMDGLRKRHTYGATDNIILDVRMGSYMMGDVIKTDKRILKIHVVGTADIDELVVVKDGEEHVIAHDNSPEITVQWEDQDVPGDGNYYYVRVLQEDGELAWSSPIWVEM